MAETNTSGGTATNGDSSTTVEQANGKIMTATVADKVISPNSELSAASVTPDLNVEQPQLTANMQASLAPTQSMTPAMPETPQQQPTKEQTAMTPEQLAEALTPQKQTAGEIVAGGGVDFKADLKTLLEKEMGKDGDLAKSLSQSLSSMTGPAQHVADAQSKALTGMNTQVLQQDGPQLS